MPGLCALWLQGSSPQCSRSAWVVLTGPRSMHRGRAAASPCRNRELRPWGCQSVQSHCSQVQKRKLRKENGIFSWEPGLVLSISLLAWRGAAPWLLPSSLQEAAAPRRPGHAPVAMAVHPQDTAAGIFLWCRQEGGERPTRGSSRDRSLVSKS